MDYETKKSIPRHLRGAATKRVRCRHCSSWHANKSQVLWCKKNPKRKEMLAKCKAGAVKGGIAKNSNPENVEKARQLMTAMNMLPQYAEMFRKARAKGGRKSRGPGFTGHHHTLEHRLRLMAYVKAHNERKSRESIPKQLERERVPVAMVQMPDFFGRKIVERDKDVWFDASDDDTFSGF